MKPHRKWTAAQVAELQRLYATTPGPDLAQHLGMGLRSVYFKAHALGLRKEKAVIADMARARMAEDHPAKAHWWAKGNEAWNKGVPGSTGKHPRSVAHHFKPGRKPQDAHNYQPVGTLRLSARDGLLERKVTDDQRLVSARRWVAEHRLVWEAEHGPVPKGCIVVFKPGQHTTQADAITADKLECITRAENMRRNSIHTKHPELVKLYQLKGAINRQSNRITREAQEQAT